MELKLYQIDAFTDQVFKGNPACVVPLGDWLPDDVLFNITKENAVAETAFFVKSGDKLYLRWFTPEIEMDLCGHATLATAFVLRNFLSYSESTITFQTLSGELSVSFDNQLIVLDLPSRKPELARLPEIIKRSLNIQPKEILKSRDFVLVYADEQQIKDIKIDRQTFDSINLDPGGVIVTAKGNDWDFVSRYFTPQSSILEDPVTGSAHCSLIPFWSERLSKKRMTALQLSDRGGTLHCVDAGDRVLVGGTAKPYSVGTLWTE